MNVLQILTELCNMLPLDNTYRTVAKGILENLDRMQDVTIYDIAEITNSSRTTVWRMIQKIGYQTFSDFRYALQAASKQYTYYNRILPVGACVDAQQTLALVTAQAKEAADILSSSLSGEEIHDLVLQLHRAERVRFYMPFRLPFISVLQQNLSKDKKDTACFLLIPDMLEDAATLNGNSIVITSTIEHAETLDLHPVFRELQAHETVIWQAGSSSSQYRHYADRLLLDMEANPMSWISALNGFFLALGEHYRATYIDIP